MVESFTYKGVVVTVDQKDSDNADIIIDGSVFRCRQVPGELSMWHCDQAFYAPDNLVSLGRHFVDFWYLFTDPNRCPPSLILEEFGGDPHGLPGHGTGGHAHGTGGTVPASTGMAVGATETPHDMGHHAKPPPRAAAKKRAPAKTVAKKATSKRVSKTSTARKR